ncbi:MAG: putative porin [Acidobacteria bacterium]|nr:putative porin [Acidobacteriota bacterium]
MTPGLFRPFRLLTIAATVLASTSAALAGDDTADRHAPRAGAPAEKPATVEEMLRRQSETLERLERLVLAQQERIARLEAEVASRTSVAPIPGQLPSVSPESSVSPPAPSRPDLDAAAANQDADAVATRLETLEKRFGNFRFSGDIRFRYEGFYNQGFDLPADTGPRNRFRVRVRAGISGRIDNHFDWGLRLSTGTFTDPISPNQTLSDFYERKPVSLERAFLRFTTDSDPVNLELHAGKFEPTWKRTAFTFDNDLTVEGASERLRFRVSKDRPLRAVQLIAWQLPFRERSAGADATILGGQILTEWSWSKNWSSTIAGTFHDFEQANVIPPALNGGSTDVNGSLEYGSTNAIVRNPFTNALEFRSDFRVVNALGELTYTGLHPRFPLMFSVEWLHNTGAFDNQRDGGYAFVTLGQRQQQGDWYFNYAFWKAERDVYPSVFMESDTLQTNSVLHWAMAAYMLRRNVELSGRYFLQRRLQTVSPVNRWLNRFQLDVVYSF